jgi:hypothetical protein
MERDVVLPREKTHAALPVHEVQYERSVEDDLACFLLGVRTLLVPYSLHATSVPKEHL